MRSGTSPTGNGSSFTLRDVGITLRDSGTTVRAPVEVGDTEKSLVSPGVSRRQAQGPNGQAVSIEVAGDDTGRPDAVSKTHRARRQLVVVLSVVMLLVLSGVGYVWFSYVFRSHPGAQSLHSVESSFKAGGRDPTAANLRYEPPAEGVYALEGQGSERISFPPNAMSDGAVMPASVTYLSDGCWRWHLDYNTAHWEEYDFCPGLNQQFQPGFRNFQSWDFGTLTVTNLASFSCPSDTVVLPDNPTSGQTLSWTCTGTNSSIKGKTLAKTASRIVGTQSLSIGKTTVRAVEEVQRTTLSGGQNGTVVETWWFSATSGLPLRIQRQIKILTASPLGTITYAESGSWQMTSLTPRR